MHFINLSPCRSLSPPVDNPSPDLHKHIYDHHPWTRHILFKQFLLYKHFQQSPPTDKSYSVHAMSPIQTFPAITTDGHVIFCSSNFSYTNISSNHHRRTSHILFMQCLLCKHFQQSPPTDKSYSVQAMSPIQTFPAITTDGQVIFCSSNVSYTNISSNHHRRTSHILFMQCLLYKHFQQSPPTDKSYSVQAMCPIQTFPAITTDGQVIFCSRNVSYTIISMTSHCLFKQCLLYKHF